MYDLNKQYFKAKEIHRNSVKKNAWITWAIIVFIGLSWLVRDVYRTVQKEENISSQSIENQIENFVLALNDTIIYSDKNNFKVLIKKGLYFGHINNEMPIMAFSNNTTNIIFYIKKAKVDEKYDSLIEQWSSNITQTNSTYSFTNIEKTKVNNIRQEFGNVKLIDNNIEFKGRILIIENGNA